MARPILFLFMACMSLPAACDETACNDFKKNVDFEAGTGQLHLLQAKATKIVNAEEIEQDPKVELGDDDCQCIGLDLEGLGQVVVGSITVPYPASTGSYCAAWDEGLWPGDCDGDDAADWCKSKWCYVDPCKCSLSVPPKVTTQDIKWQGAQAYWSYATCGGKDTFSAGNEKACVNQKEEDACKKLDSCAWDGKLCLGKELVDHCEKKNDLSEEDYGTKTCKCVGWEKAGYMNVSFGGSNAKYPASLGGKCAAWDDGIYPDCKKDDAPDWCKQKWCYVDPCNCELPKSQPKVTGTGAKYKDQLVYWSYGTCGGEDKFTEDLDKLPKHPPEFCGGK